MGKLFLIMGKSATGKDHIFRDVVAAFEGRLKTVVSYTTRPQRVGETDGVEYHFVSEAEMERMRAAGKILECRCYHTVAGPWYYFTADDGQFRSDGDSGILIVTPEAYRELRKSVGEDTIVPIYIEVEGGERLARALKRERKQDRPNYDELCRRFLADEKDFSDAVLAELGIDRRFTNDDYDTCVAEIVEAVAQTPGGPGADSIDGAGTTNGDGCRSGGPGAV